MAGPGTRGSPGEGREPPRPAVRGQQRAALGLWVKLRVPGMVCATGCRGEAWLVGGGWGYQVGSCGPIQAWEEREERGDPQANPAWAS